MTNGIILTLLGFGLIIGSAVILLASLAGMSPLVAMAIIGVVSGALGLILRYSGRRVV
jgi:hypothetical protein